MIFWKKDDIEITKDGIYVYPLGCRHSAGFWLVLNKQSVAYSFRYSKITGKFKISKIVPTKPVPDWAKL